MVAVDKSGSETVVATSRPGLGDAETLFQGRFSNWRQARVDLSPFAGQDGLKLRFDYEDNSPGRANEGVYVDDLIIGFAERGEMVTGAGPGGQFVGNPDLNPSDLTQGNYQLEIRKSTEFGTSTDLASSGLALHTSYDTNDRLALQTTMIVPDGKNIVDGQTFVISDGLNSVTFEFDDPSLSNGVAGNNIIIPFKSPKAGGGYARTPIM